MNYNWFCVELLQLENARSVVYCLAFVVNNDKNYGTIINSREQGEPNTRCTGQVLAHRAMQNIIFIIAVKWINIKP